MCRFPQYIHLFPHIFVYTSAHAPSPRLKEHYRGTRLDILHNGTQERGSRIHWDRNMGLPGRTSKEMSALQLRVRREWDKGKTGEIQIKK